MACFRHHLLPLIAAAASAAIFPPAAADWERGAVIEGQPRVIDGDTVEIGSSRIRLAGGDAYEAGQTCRRKDTGAEVHIGAAATKMLEALARSLDRHPPMRCTVRDTDRYGRAVAVCTVLGLDAMAVMVAAGLAVDDPRHLPDYGLLEAVARSAGVGA